MLFTVAVAFTVLSSFIAMLIYKRKQIRNYLSERNYSNNRSKYISGRDVEINYTVIPEMKYQAPKAKRARNEAELLSILTQNNVDI
eukprot:Pgem_evm1s11094